MKFCFVFCVFVFTFLALLPITPVYAQQNLEGCGREAPGHCIKRTRNGHMIELENTCNRRVVSFECSTRIDMHDFYSCHVVGLEPKVPVELSFGPFANTSFSSFSILAAYSDYAIEDYMCLARNGMFVGKDRIQTSETSNVMVEIISRRNTPVYAHSLRRELHEERPDLSDWIIRRETDVSFTVQNRHNNSCSYRVARVLVGEDNNFTIEKVLKSLRSSFGPLDNVTSDEQLASYASYNSDAGFYNFSTSFVRGSHYIYVVEMCHDDTFIRDRPYRLMEWFDIYFLLRDRSGDADASDVDALYELAGYVYSLGRTYQAAGFIETAMKITGEEPRDLPQNARRVYRRSLDRNDPVFAAYLLYNLNGEYGFGLIRPKRHSFGFYGQFMLRTGFSWKKAWEEDQIPPGVDQIETYPRYDQRRTHTRTGDFDYMSGALSLGLTRRVVGPIWARAGLVGAYRKYAELIHIETFQGYETQSAYESTRHMTIEDKTGFYIGGETGLSLILGRFYLHYGLRYLYSEFDHTFGIGVSGLEF